MADSYEKILRVFRQIAVLVKASKRVSDRFYREAFDRLQMSEFQELCLGYSFNSTAGAGSGQKLKSVILAAAKEIISAGIEDPEIFELVGLFEEGVGPDRISDMIGHMISEDLKSYSRRVVSMLSTNKAFKADVPIVDGLLVNPFNHRPLILLPRELLHELPIAKEWEDIDHVCSVNREVREKINDAIGDQWRELTITQKKSLFKRVVLDDPLLLKKLLKDYRESALEEYDFSADPLGEAIWLSVARECANNYPLTLRAIKTSEDLQKVVLSICMKFKEVVEINALNEVLYTDEGVPRHERIAQKLFHGIAASYCEANEIDIDISPEVNSGRGAVDFKFSFGASKKVLVEVKLTTNTHLVRGYAVQLREYEKSERTDNGYYLVIDNGGPQTRIDELLRVHEEFAHQGIQKHEIILVDGRFKPSASKMRSSFNRKSS